MMNLLALWSALLQKIPMAGQAFRSKLQPHWNLIRDLRRRRKTWAQIAEILTREHGCSTQTQSVYAFYKRKLKNPAPLGFEEEPSLAIPAPVVKSLSSEPLPDSTAQALSGQNMLEEYRKRSAALNEELLRPRRIVLKTFEPLTQATEANRVSGESEQMEGE